MPARVLEEIPSVRRVSEFSGDPLDVVLRTLARQAKMNVVVSPAVQGTINLRLEDKTPREVIEVVCQANGLIMDELNGVYYIKTAAEKAKEPTESFQYTFSYAQAMLIAPLLKTQLNSGLTPDIDVRTNTIFYREGKSNAEKIEKFLASVDKPTQQVMIEARLVEVNANPKQSYGINWAGTVGGIANPQTFKVWWVHSTRKRWPLERHRCPGANWPTRSRRLCRGRKRQESRKLARQPVRHSQRSSNVGHAAFLERRRGS
jgi:type II secretory pathway component GspD/PulD (secretin)